MSKITIKDKDNLLDYLITVKPRIVYLPLSYEEDFPESKVKELVNRPDMIVKYI
jgi:hypothetical protein